MINNNTMNFTAQDLSGVLGGKKCGSGWMVPCVSHQEKEPSLHISEKDGKVLVHCFGGCSQDAVLSELKDRNLWPGGVGKPYRHIPDGIPDKWYGRKHIKHWPYFHEKTGEIIGYDVRYEGPSAEKEPCPSCDFIKPVGTFKCPRCQHESGKKVVIPFFKKDGEKWKSGALDIKPLYGILTDSTRPVLICEGAKATDAAHGIVKNSFDCISWQGGVDSADKADWRRLTGRDVIIWPDNDKPGFDAAANIKAVLEQIGVDSVKVVHLPENLPEKWDLADAEGWTAEDVLTMINSGKPRFFAKPLDIAKSLFEVPPTVRWLCHDRVVHGRGMTITALGGTSKTRLLYHLAVGVVTGYLPWSWEMGRQGKAVLILTEDVADDAQRVIHWIGKSLTPEQQHNLVENLKIYPLAGYETILLKKTSTGTLEKTKLYYDLLDLIQSWDDVQFVGLDPALSITEGDELDQNNARQLGKLVDDLAVTTDTTVALVCHASKASLNTAELTSHNSRGAGALTDAVRAELSMRNMTPDEARRANVTEMIERKRIVQLVATKGNNLPPSAFVPIWLRRGDFGNLEEIQLEWETKGTLKENDLKILKGHSEIAVNGAANLADWRQRCVDQGLIKGDTDDARNKAMTRVRKKLQQLGLIATGEKKGVWIQPSLVEDSGT